MRKLASLAALLAASACGGSSTDADEAFAPVPAEWVSARASCGYGFRAPPDVMMQAAQGTDSCVDGWVAGACVYGGDYGGFSSDLSEYAEFSQYEVTRETIDGHSAKVVTAAAPEYLVAAVNFAEGDPDIEGLGLSVWAQCQDTAGQQEALMLIRTITLPPREK